MRLGADTAVASRKVGDEIWKNFREGGGAPVDGGIAEAVDGGIVEVEGGGIMEVV